MKREVARKEKCGKNKNFFKEIFYRFIVQMSYKDSIGQNGIIVFDSNRVPLILDSKYRFSNFTPYQFTTALNSNVAVSEMYYSKLYWNQPFFSHNALSSELIFQIKYEDGTISPLYVTYAAPFMMYGQYDGNADNTFFEAPQPGSYAFMMESGLNYDVRYYNTNMTPITEGADTGRIYSTFSNLPVQMRFRYSASKGFSIFALTDDGVGTVTYLNILIHDCSYISEAHYVHGFGIYDTTSNTFKPRSQWVQAYYSDGTPTLLPYRFIVIGSVDLTRDRRCTSFGANINTLNLTDEVAVFPLSAKNTGKYHVLTAGEDSTVFALRSNYQPNIVSIRISTDSKTTLTCGDPVSLLLKSSWMPSYHSEKYLDPTSEFYGRGTSSFINFLVFGTNITALPETLWFEMDGTVFKPLILDQNISTPFLMSSDLFFLRTASKFPYYKNSSLAHDQTSWQRTCLHIPAKRGILPPQNPTLFQKNTAANQNILPTVTNLQLELSMQGAETPSWVGTRVLNVNCGMFRKSSLTEATLVWIASQKGKDFKIVGGVPFSNMPIDFALDTTPATYKRMMEVSYVNDGEDLFFAVFLSFNDGLPSVVQNYEMRIAANTEFAIKGTTVNSLAPYITTVPQEHYPPGVTSIPFHPDYRADADALCEDIIHEFIGVMETS